MNRAGISTKTLIAFSMSLVLLIFTLIPILGFFIDPETVGELIRKIDPLRILVFYLCLGVFAVMGWIVSREILAEPEKNLTGWHRGLAFFSKVVCSFLAIVLISLQVFFSIGTIIVYWGSTLFGVSFGNLRFYRENSFLLVLSHLVVPLLIAFFVFAFQRKKQILARFGNMKLLAALSSSVSPFAQRLKAVILICVAFYMVLAWTRPQLGTKMESVKREGVDIMVALDVSYSMMAEDIAPNRLEKAKHEVESLIDRLQGDRIGLIAFAGVPFVQCPLTLDYGAANIFLDIISPDLIPEPGTALGAAIDKAVETFDQNERQHKVLILITDGEDHEADPLESAKKAAETGVVIYTVGLGNPAGVPIPQYGPNGGLQGFKKDRSGKEVVTKLDEVTLEKIALLTDGKHYTATAGEVELDKIYDEISQMEKKELGSKKFSQYEDRFQYVLVFALFLLIAELFIPERKTKRIW